MNIASSASGNGISVCVFDAYGTLFDVNAAARRAASEPENAAALAPRWQKLASDWRFKQLQYTWLRAITGAHADFWQVTGEALDWAMEAAALADPRLHAHLMDLYRALDAYPEVPQMLAQLKSAGLQTAILSNGSQGMLDSATSSAGINPLLDAVLSVDAVGIYKPAPQVYDLVGQRFGCDRASVLFVSSNGWDAAAAAGYGFETVWVNRHAEPVERLPWRAAHVLTDLRSIPDLAGG